MAKQKYNWWVLKTEFMLSNHIEVAWYLREKWIPSNSRVLSRTTWRSKEKKKLYENFKTKIMEEYNLNMENELSLRPEHLLRWRKAALYRILKLLWNSDSKLTITDLVRMISVLDNELYNEKERLNKNDKLTEEDLELLDLIKIINDKKKWTKKRN